MKKKTLLAVLAAGIVAGLLFTGCAKKDGPSGGKQTFILKMSTQLNESSPMVGGFKEWAKAVEEKTSGNLKIEVFPSAQLGSDEDVIEQALQGVNVAVLTDGGRMANYVKDIGIIGMPYIAGNYDELRKITESKTFAAWDAQLIQNGMRILSYNWYDGPRNFYTTKPVNVPADLNGQRIRTPGAPVWAKSVESMGATPIAMGWNDSYNALQSKSIDGVEVQSTSAYPARMYEVLKYINKTEHFQLANFIMVGEKWFSALPADYQKILMDECKKASYENAQIVLKTAGDYEKLMIEKGMIITNPDKAAFSKAAEKAYDELGFKTLRDQIWSEIGKK
ncbi:C4-dicarboxylate TRAP transporter substrate-binding protein [Treponema primitia]|uniref:C4-dicarboxylate TRAP transporter substrate-binding protein n=1 Tax=Treponema primitia TaxID=88058 RepID=UPI003980BDAE